VQQDVLVLALGAIEQGGIPFRPGQARRVGPDRADEQQQKKADEASAAAAAAAKAAETK